MEGRKTKFTLKLLICIFRSDYPSGHSDQQKRIFHKNQTTDNLISESKLCLQFANNQYIKNGLRKIKRRISTTKNIEERHACNWQIQHEIAC